MNITLFVFSNAACLVLEFVDPRLKRGRQETAHARARLVPGKGVTRSRVDLRLRRMIGTTIIGGWKADKLVETGHCLLER